MPQVVLLSREAILRSGLVILRLGSTTFHRVSSLDVGFDLLLEVG